jgi:diguanylate cyclase (GGDEF)-like protein/PAS domain S-box-containing protein
MNYAELLEIPSLQSLLDSLSKVTGLANAVIDVDGRIIALAGWRDACVRFHRHNAESCQRCQESDTSIVRQTMLGADFVVYPCPNGLIDVAVPIMIEGKHVANLFAGQFLARSPDMAFFRRQAQQFGFDETTYLDAIARVPVIPLATVETHARLYAQIAATLGESGLDRLRQKQATEELRRLNAELGRRIDERTHALSQSEERLRLALGAARQGWFDLDVQTGRVTVAPEYANLLGYAPVAFTTTIADWLRHIHPDDRAAVHAAYQNVVATGEASSIVYRRKRGKDGWLWIETTAEVVGRDAQGKPRRMIGIHKDISERKRMEDETTFLRALVERSACPVYAIDMDDDFRVVFVNRATCEHYGMTREELLQTRVADWDAQVTPEKLDAHRAKLLFSDALHHFETQHRRKDGSVVPVEIAAGRFLFQGHNITSGFILDISERKRLEEKIRKLAYTDPLTGLPNRRLLLDRLAQALQHAKRYRRSLAIMFLDLDNFKRVNDTLGHDVGDELLKEVAVRLGTCVRSGDTVSRTGGDEFIIVLSEIARPVDAAQVATKIIDAINVPVRLADATLRVSPSIGIAVYPVDGDDDTLDLMMKADKSMYVAKKAGGNTYHLAAD